MSASRHRRSCWLPRRGSTTAGGHQRRSPSSCPGSCTRCGPAATPSARRSRGTATACRGTSPRSTSYGNAALGRAAAVGAAFAGDPASAALAASADAAVTHAERHATAASAALAAIVAGLIRRDPATTPVDVCRSGRRGLRRSSRSRPARARAVVAARRRRPRRGSGAGASAPTRRWRSPCGARSPTTIPPPPSPWRRASSTGRTPPAPSPAPSSGPSTAPPRCPQRWHTDVEGAAALPAPRPPTRRRAQP